MTKQKMKNTYLVGAASCDITPPVGIKLAGFLALREPSTSVELPLRATVLVISDATTSTLLLSAEWLGFYEVARQVRSQISKATGIPEGSIAVVTTHTHAGPCVRERDKVKGPLDEAYIAGALKSFVKCALTAVENREPCHLDFYRRGFPLAINRRRPDGSGGVTWGPWEAGLKDPTLSLIVATRAKTAQPKALFFSYACHPTSRSTTDIGGDYVGFTYRALDTLYPGLPIGFFQGFAGDQKPHFINKEGTAFRPASSCELEELGKKLASTLHSCLQSGKGKLSVNGSLISRSQTVYLEASNPSEALHQTFAKSTMERVSEWAQRYPWQRDAPPPPPVPFEVQSVSFGTSLAFIFLAGEISVGYALTLREGLREHFKAIIPIGYANEMAGYIPTRAQILEGGYEVWYSRQLYGNPGFFTETIEERILQTVKELLTRPQER